MGLLDGILGNAVNSALGGQHGGQDPLATMLGGLMGQATAGHGNGVLGAVMGLVQQHGGLSGVLDMFNESGMAEHAQSWVSTGDNLPIDSHQVQQVFGGSIGDLASKLGLSSDQASSSIAQLLPQLVNQLTPTGSVPENHNDLLSRAMSMLGGKS